MTERRMARWPWSRRPEPAEPPAAWAPASWPPDSATLARWLHTELLADAATTSRDEGLTIDGLDGIRITADVDGADVTRLIVDATGVDLRASAHRTSLHDAASSPVAADPVIVERTSATLHSARLLAAPVSLQGYPVHVDVAVSQVPFAWARYAEAVPGRPTSRFGIEDAEGSDAMVEASGTFAARMRADDLAPLITDIATPLLAEAGVRLRRFTATVSATRRQVVTVRGSAAVRWKIFGASASVIASVEVTPDAVITVNRLRVRSANPLVMIGLAVARSELRAIEGETLDLNASMAAEGEAVPRVHDVRVTVDDDIAVSGRFG